MYDTPRLNNAAPFRANGTIGPSRFVVQDSSGDNLVLEAGSAVTITANNGVAISGTQVPVIGISQVGPKFTPGLSSGNVNVAAQKGDSIDVFSLGDVAPLRLSGAVIAGDLLMCNGTIDGTGVAVNWIPGTFLGASVGAKALQAGVNGNIVMVQIVSFFI